jgi:hypothetical protein
MTNKMKSEASLHLNRGFFFKLLTGVLAILIAGLLTRPSFGAPGASVAVSAPNRQPISISPATGAFAVHVSMMVSQNPNAGIAICSEAAWSASVNTGLSGFEQLPVTIRAIGTSNGPILQARPAAGYPTTGFSVPANVPFDIIVTGQVGSASFSAWLVLPGQPATQIASFLGFRPGAQQSPLDTILVWSDVGSVTVQNVIGNGLLSTYDQIVLADHPVLYLPMLRMGSTETDLSGSGNTGTYHGAAPASITLPNGDLAAMFDGYTSYLSVQSNPSFSIPTTGKLTVEAWIQPTAWNTPTDLEFPIRNQDGYVGWAGKCSTYGNPPTCEWSMREYGNSGQTGTADRLDIYVFNPTAGYGASADWQPKAGVIHQGMWLYVVGEVTMLKEPPNCPNPATYPGSLDVFVNAILWLQSAHAPTGCLSQPTYGQIIPKAGPSPLFIGTLMALPSDMWFQGAIAKFAIYDDVLSDTDVANHYRAMVGQNPTGVCDSSGDCSLN